MQESLSELSTGLSKIYIEPTQTPLPPLTKPQIVPKCPPGMSNLVIGVADFAVRFQKQFAKTDHPIGVSLCNQLLHDSENFDEDEVIFKNENQQYPAFNIPNMVNRSHGHMTHSDMPSRSPAEWCESRRLSKSTSNIKQIAHVNEFATKSRPNTPGRSRRNRGRKVDLELFR